MKSILDPSFRYVPSVKQGVAATFDRICRDRKPASKPDEAVVRAIKPRIVGKAQ